MACCLLLDVGDGCRSDNLSGIVGGSDRCGEIIQVRVTGM